MEAVSYTHLDVYKRQAKTYLLGILYRMPPMAAFNTLHQGPVVIPFGRPDGVDWFRLFRSNLGPKSASYAQRQSAVPHIHTFQQRFRFCFKLRCHRMAVLQFVQDGACAEQMCIRDRPHWANYVPPTTP